MCPTRRLACALFAFCAAVSVCFTERLPVLRQIDLPHPYYFREMYLPQLTSGPSSLAWSPDSRELIYSMAGSLLMTKRSCFQPRPARPTCRNFPAVEALGIDCVAIRCAHFVRHLLCDLLTQLQSVLDGRFNCSLKVWRAVSIARRLHNKP
jgi:hypothetical protein